MIVRPFLLKIMHFVLMVLMLIRFTSQLFSSFFNAVLSPSLLSDKIIRSSAHRRDPMGEPSFSYGGGGGGERGEGARLTGIE